MQSSGHRKARTGTLLLTAGLLGGCIVIPAPGYYPGSVRVALPLPSVEFVGVAPVPGFVWFGGRRTWVGGHWGPGREYD
jgi:hypothetical protein